MRRLQPSPPVEAIETIAEPWPISGSTVSVRWRVPMKLTLKVSMGGKAPPPARPAQLNSPSIRPPIAATPASIDAASRRSIWVERRERQRGLLEVEPVHFGAEIEQDLRSRFAMPEKQPLTMTRLPL